MKADHTPAAWSRLERLPGLIRFLATSRLRTAVGLVANELIRRISSRDVFHVLRYELSNDVERASAWRPVSLETLENSNVAPLFAFRGTAPTTGELKALVECYLFSHSDLKQGYAGVDEDGQAVVVCWLLDSSQNRRLQSHFGGAVAPVKQGEVLLEFVYTRPDCRGQNLMAWITRELFILARANGNQWATAYVRATNAASLTGARRIGWRIAGCKRVSRTLFRRAVRFEIDEIPCLSRRPQ